MRVCVRGIELRLFSRKRKAVRRPFHGVRAKRAGVKPFTPDDLRRTFVSRLLDAGVDIAIVAKMAGHSNIQTTARYDRRPEEAKQRAAKLLQIPYAQHVFRLKSLKERQSVYNFSIVENLQLHQQFTRNLPSLVDPS